jgi:hypothetical protein
MGAKLKGPPDPPPEDDDEEPPKLRVGLASLEEFALEPTEVTELGEDIAMDAAEKMVGGDWI